MQHSPDDKWDEYGCFVYKVIAPCDVRNCPNILDESRTTKCFKKGDMVSVDLIRSCRFKDSTNGPFLRLSDNSGWLFERKLSDVMMKRVHHVEVGLWTFYADNCPSGIAMRRHPIDCSGDDIKQRVAPQVRFLPMQKLFCDRKVTSDAGVNFYRVQGTDGWVFDKRGDRHMLLAERLVRTGLFAYQVVDKGSVGIRNIPNVGDVHKTKSGVSNGDIVAVNAVRDSPEYNTGNGPFVRLTDGSGWLFENKNHEQCLEEIPVISGIWRLRVVNSAGIQLRMQPIDNKNCHSDVYKQHEECVCDRMIASPSGVNFYRVKDTHGWVFDKRNGSDMMRLIQSSGLTTNGSSASAHGNWTPDFVRGVAMAVGSLEEISFNEQSRLISFRCDKGVRFNIYYTTRTIGTAMDHPRQGSTQLFRRNCGDAELAEVMRNPRLHTGKGYQKKRTRSDSGELSGVEIDGEEELRRTLLECDEEMEQLQGRRLNILKSLKIHCEKRAASEEYLEHLREVKAQEAQRVEDARRRQAQEEEARRQRDIRGTCSVCQRVFANPHAMQQHYRATHEFPCDYCDKVCYSSHSLSQHKDATRHW